MLRFFLPRPFLGFPCMGIERFLPYTSDLSMPTCGEVFRFFMFPQKKNGSRDFSQEPFRIASALLSGNTNQSSVQPVVTNIVTLNANSMSSGNFLGKYRHVLFVRPSSLST